MLSLPNNSVLLASETGDGCIAKLHIPPQQSIAGGPFVPRSTVTSTLHNAAPVSAFAVANLQQLPQDQVGHIFP